MEIVTLNGISSKILNPVSDLVTLSDGKEIYIYKHKDEYFMADKSVLVLLDSETSTVKHIQLKSKEKEKLNE